MMDDGGWMWGHGWGWAGWLTMCVVVLLLWGGLIAAVALGVRYLGASDHRPRQVAARRRPEDVLAQRYAGGEIDDEEFRHRLSMLREHRVGP